MPQPSPRQTLRHSACRHARQHARHLLLAACAALPGLAIAQAGLARENGCLVCHAVEKKVIGPAFRDVAARYAGQPGAAERLAETVLKGGVGQWGRQPMPPNGGVSAEDALQLTTWLLTMR